jgi:hypothetical protein
MAFSIHSIYRQIFKIWRRKRFDLFLRLIEPAATDDCFGNGVSSEQGVPKALR